MTKSKGRKARVIDKAFGNKAPRDLPPRPPAEPTTSGGGVKTTSDTTKPYDQPTEETVKNIKG